MYLPVYWKRFRWDQIESAVAYTDYDRGWPYFVVGLRISDRTDSKELWPSRRADSPLGLAECKDLAAVIAKGVGVYRHSMANPVIESRPYEAHRRIGEMRATEFFAVPPT